MMPFHEQRVAKGKEIVERSLKKLAQEYTVAKETREELAKLREGKLPDITRKLLNYMKADVTREVIRQPYCLTDPIYGGIYLEPEFLPLFFHPIVQRLNFIRQLSFSYLEFPHATHTRLSHCIGTAHAIEMSLNRMLLHGKVLRGKSLSDLPDSSLSLSRKLLFLGKTCGLLHDCGHGPFAHTLDRWMGLRLDLGKYGIGYQAKPDKFFSLQYIKGFLSGVITQVGQRYGFGVSNVVEVFEGKTHDPFEYLIFQLIDSTLDLDRADFLTRDPYITGLPVRVLNLVSLVDLVVPVEDGDRYKVAFREEALQNILHFLEMRKYMYDNCYDRDKKVAAEAMLTTAVQTFCTENPGLDIQSLELLTDEQLLDLIASSSSWKSSEFELVNDLRQGLVYEKILELKLPAKPANPEIESFLKNIMNPKLRKKMYIDKAIEWGQNISPDEETSKRVIVVPFSIESQEQRSFLEVKILVEDTSGYQIRTLEDLRPSIKEEMTAWVDSKRRIAVFASPRLSASVKDEIRDNAKSYFGPPLPP
jgi:HD superfamily phosphohydrolase